MNALAISGALFIGLSLGLTGAGGSIITLPVLVYVAGLPAKEAVGVSLFVVAIAALLGAVQRARAGEFHARAALLFALSGMAGATVGARLTPWVPAPVLMSLFALLMLAVALHMWLGRPEGISLPAECRPLRCLLAGTGVGLLTGFIGVGGGFLLVPALIKFARLPQRIATGTSLAVIAFNSAAGFFSHVGEATAHWPLALLFAGMAVVGVLLGSFFASRLPVKKLQKGFALLVFATGVYVLWQNGLSLV